jgi:DNA polymerase-3 subunit delta'
VKWYGQQVLKFTGTLDPSNPRILVNDIMSFKAVMGHERPIEFLRRAIKHDKLAHSYLFLGNEGIGKRWTALQFAKAVNCIGGGSDHEDACDHCSSCKKIDHLLHPDLLLIEPEGQTLKVDQVRQMQKDLTYQPYEGKRRFCILTAADRMAPNMANILLKTLEEPPLHTVIILLANSPRLLLPTILSRCQPIRFNPLPVPSVAKWLMERRGLDEKEAGLLASLSEGSPGKALEIEEEIRGVPRREMLEGWVGLRSLSFEKMEIWIEALPSHRENLILILEVARTLLRDLVMVKVLKGNFKLIHADLAKEMEAIATKWNLSSLLKRIAILHQTTLAIRRNANTTLALETMMLSWA